MTTPLRVPTVPITELEQSAFCRTDESLASKSSRGGVRRRRTLAEAAHLVPEGGAGRAGRAHRGRQGPARRPARGARPPLPARRDHQVRRPARRLLQAVAVRGLAAGRRVHRLLRRPLHGRDGGRAQLTRAERRAAQPVGGLLHGRHGAHRRRAGLLGRPRGDAGRLRRSRPDHVHELDRGHKGALRQGTAASSAHRRTRPRPSGGPSSAASACSSCPISTWDATPPSSSGSGSTR